MMNSENRENGNELMLKGRPASEIACYNLWMDRTIRERNRKK